GGIFLRREILRVIEDHGPKNIQPRYAMIFRDQEPVAALAVQVVTVTGESLASEKEAHPARKPTNVLRRALAPAARKASKALRERMLVAGNLLSWGFHGLAFKPGEDP